MQVKVKRTWKSNGFDWSPLLDKPLLKQLGLRSLATTIQPFQDNKRAASPSSWASLTLTVRVRMRVSMSLTLTLTMALPLRMALTLTLIGSVTPVRVVLPRRL